MLPVHKAFALQIGQGCTELVGKQDESGQVQTVLPHLQERAQLQTEKEETQGCRVLYMHTEHREPESYLSKSTELHDDPHRVLCDDSDQLNNVRVVKLSHCHCVVNKHVVIETLKDK